jgi:hypothetical protein
MQGYGGAPDRNVRPRTSGGGGAPAAAAGRYGVPPPGMPVGPPRQQQGFQPGAQQSQAVGFNPAAAAQQRGPPGYGAPGYGAGEDGKLVQWSSVLCILRYPRCCITLQPPTPTHPHPQYGTLPADGVDAMA